MKFLNLIFCLLAFATTNIVAQTEDPATLTLTDFVTGLNNPYGIAVHGNTLYVAEKDGNKISKIDLTQATPTAVDFITGVSSPWGLAVYGDDLYIAEYSGNKVSKVSLTTQNPTAIDFAEVDRPFALRVIENDLFVCSATVSRSSKFNLASNPVTSEVISLFGYDYMSFNELIYYTFPTTSSAALTTYNESNETHTPVNVSNEYVHGIHLYGNTMFAVRKGLAQFDLTTFPPTKLASVDFGDDSGKYLAIHNGVLYLSRAGDNSNKIQTLDLATLSPLSTPQFEALGLSLVANPVGDVLELAPPVPAQTPYVIYSLLGAEVQTGVINTQGNIALPSLTKGMFLLRIQNQPILRFIKP